MATAVEPLRRLAVRERDRRLSPAALLALLRLGDALLLSLAGCVATWRLGAGSVAPPGLALGLATLLFLNLAEAAGLYELRGLKRRAGQACAVAACACMALLGTALLGGGALPAGFAWRWLATAAPMLALSRLCLPALVERLERGGRLAARVVVVGAGEQGQRLIQRLRGAKAGFRLIGLFDDRRTRVPHYIGGYPVLGGVDELVAFAARHPIDLVVVALPGGAEARILECLRRLRQIPVDVRVCPDLIGLQLGHRGVTELAGVPLLNVFDRPLPGWSRAAKEVLDRLLAALVLVLTGPLLLLIALAVRLGSPGPALYRQRRHGLNGAVIEVLKFRTMRAETCGEGGGPGTAFRQARRGDPRVTPLGRLLRRTSLDELPQFLNVLRGEMSIVGPRPHAVAHSEAMAPLVDAYPARHRVKPGITGWAQVNGHRGETDTLEKMERRLEHDLHYIENWSLSLDLRIILRTLLVGFTGPNAY